MTTRCDKAARLQLKQSEGAPLSPKETRFLSSHLATCETCTAETAILSFLASDSPYDHDETLDELATHRERDKVLSALDIRRRQEERRSSDDRNPLLLAGGIAAACLVACVSVTLLVSPGEAPFKDPTGPATRVERNEGHRAGTPDREAPLHREILETGSDSTTLDLGREIRVMLHPRTRAAVQRSTEGVSVELLSGEVLASLPPDRDRAPFRVQTRAGEVIVTGTIFSVVVSPSSVVVSVARGHVLVRRPSTEDETYDVILNGDRLIWTFFPDAVYDQSNSPAAEMDRNTPG